MIDRKMSGIADVRILPSHCQQTTLLNNLDLFLTFLFLSLIISCDSNCFWMESKLFLPRRSLNTAILAGALAHGLDFSLPSRSKGLAAVGILLSLGPLMESWTPGLQSISVTVPEGPCPVAFTIPF